MALMDEILQATIGKREFVMTLTKHDKATETHYFVADSIEKLDPYYKPLMNTRLYKKITVKPNNF